MRGAALGDQEAEAGSQQCPGHLREREKQQVPTPESVDGPERGEGEDEVDETKAPRCEQSLETAGTGGLEDGGRVESDDVDTCRDSCQREFPCKRRKGVSRTAHLLGKHNNERCERGTAHTGNGEQLEEAGNVIALANDFGLDGKLSVHVV